MFNSITDPFQATAKAKRQASQSPSPSPSPNRRSRHQSPSPAQSPKVRGRSAFHRESARPVFHRPSSQESDSVISEVADSRHEKIMIADSISLDEALESEFILKVPVMSFDCMFFVSWYVHKYVYMIIKTASLSIISGCCTVCLQCN